MIQVLSTGLRGGMVKETVRDVVGGFVTGVKSGVAKTPMKAGLEIDLSARTESKIDEVIANVGLLQEKTANDLRSIFTDVVQEVTRDLETMVQATTEKIERISDTTVEKIDHRWYITQVLIVAGMVGNALAMLIVM